MQVKVKFIDSNRNKRTPIYATSGAAGMDFFSDADYVIKPGGITLVKTNIAMAIPSGYELQIRSRSGLALKSGVFVLNAPGTIDSDYRGEIGIIICNLGSETYYVNAGDRIAQGVFAKHETAKLEIVDEISETDRASGGFGSTGLK